MKKYLILAMLGLSSCANVPTDNATACAQALFAANTSNPATLLTVALSTPSCVVLGETLIQDLINQISRKQALRGVR